jgi:hypothetical protein
MLRAVLLLSAVLSAGLLSGPADARARDRGDHSEEEYRDNRREERLDDRRERRESASDAAHRAQMRNGGGRVLSVEPFGAGHRVKVLKDGVVRVYIIEGN